MVGSFVRGLLTAMSAHLTPAVSAVVGIGLCGALTTYSTFSYEILRLLEDRARFYALAYVAASLVGGFGAVGLGWRGGPRAGGGGGGARGSSARGAAGGQRPARRRGTRVLHRVEGPWGSSF